MPGGDSSTNISKMTRDTLFAEIMRLPLDERLRLLEDVWDEIAAAPDAVPVPDWHREELDRRLNDSAAATVSRDELRARLGSPPE